MRQRYKDCYELAKALSCFDIIDGKINFIADYDVIDCHTHLGLSYLFSRKVKYLEETDGVKHEFPERDCPVILDVFSGENVSRFKKKDVRKHTVLTTVVGRKTNKTFTIPNLLSEMERMRITHSLVLPVEMPMGARVTKNYLKVMDNSSKLTFFCSVQPLKSWWKKRMKKYVSQGVKGLKIHPYTMACAPDSKRCMRLIDEWYQYKLPVLFHCGYSGIEPKFVRKWADMTTYELPIKKFPKIDFILGHAGSKFYRDAISYARKYENVYLELSGQPESSVKEIIENVDNDRIIFGSDWPFYPMMLPLAKVMLGTEGNEDVRRKVLSGNARRLFGIDSG